MLIVAIKYDLDVIAKQNPDAVIIFAGDLNQLNVTWLTHGSKILDYFVSVPRIYCCTTFSSTVKTNQRQY